MEVLNEDFFIRPLLDKGQIGESTIDFRLGYDFFVSIQGRDSTMNASLNDFSTNQSLADLFAYSRRRPGETFVLYPNQTVIGVSLEYVKLSGDLCLILGLRSSYSRLGLYSSSLFQPGYAGCLSLELTNLNKTPVKVTIGARIFQARLAKMGEKTNYFSNERKYACQTRPKLSALHDDKDLSILKRYYDSLQS